MKAYLVSPNKVKEDTPVDANVAGEYLSVAIKEAQEIDLVEVIGTNLYNKLQDLVVSGINDPENKPYKDLLDDYVANFLIYAAEARLMPIVSYKVANAGVVTTDDDHIDNSEYKTIMLLRDEAINKRDVYKKRLQKFLCKNKSVYYKGVCDDEVHRQLYSSSSCPIWLGGYRSGRR